MKWIMINFKLFKSKLKKKTQNFLTRDHNTINIIELSIINNIIDFNNL